MEHMLVVQLQLTVLIRQIYIAFWYLGVLMTTSFKTAKSSAISSRVLRRGGHEATTFIQLARQKSDFLTSLKLAKAYWTMGWYLLLALIAAAGIILFIFRWFRASDIMAIFCWIYGFCSFSKLPRPVSLQIGYQIFWRPFSRNQPFLNETIVGAYVAGEAERNKKEHKNQVWYSQNGEYTDGVAQELSFPIIARRLSSICGKVDSHKCLAQHAHVKENTENYQCSLYSYGSSFRLIFLLPRIWLSSLY